MQAVSVEGFESSPSLSTDAPSPAAPAAGEVVVKVQASSINPIDNAIAAGMLKDYFPHEFPIVLGRDFAGVVEEVGDGVDGVSVGDEVFGIVPVDPTGVRLGAWAERIVSAEDMLALKPANIDTAVAGAATLAVGTAILLVDALQLSAGDKVLIVGATGGVGSVAAQLAVESGATVIAPGREDDEAFLRSLGISEIVPRDGDVVAAVRERFPEGVDAIIDNVSMGTTGTYDGALKDGGRVASPTNAAGEGDGRTDVMSIPFPAELIERIAGHLADGSVEITIQRTYELSQAPEALGDLAAQHTQGKLALRLS